MCLKFQMIALLAIFSQFIQQSSSCTFPSFCIAVSASAKHCLNTLCTALNAGVEWTQAIVISHESFQSLSYQWSDRTRIQSVKQPLALNSKRKCTRFYQVLTLIFAIICMYQREEMRCVIQPRKVKVFFWLLLDNGKIHDNMWPSKSVWRACLTCSKEMFFQTC